MKFVEFIRFRSVRKINKLTIGSKDLRNYSSSLFCRLLLPGLLSKELLGHNADWTFCTTETIKFTGLYSRLQPMEYNDANRKGKCADKPGHA